MPMQYESRGRDTAPGDIFIATPSGSGQPRPNYVASLQATFDLLREKGIAADYLFHTGDCHVDDARNTIVRKFMESGCPKLLFIDDDVGWEPVELIDFIRHGRDVVAGIYPKKTDDTDFPVMTFPGRLEADTDGLVKVRGVPTGFLMLSRGAMEKMISVSVPYFQEQSDEKPNHLVFERGVVNGKRWSGDYYFCRKWLENGGEIFVDPELRLTHCGLKTWDGILGQWWCQKHGVSDPRLDKVFEILKSGNDSEDVFTALAGMWGNIPYAAESDMVKACYDHALAGGQILEIGAGLSTLVMGVAALKSGAEIWTFEHDMAWFRKMRDAIKRYRLPNIRLCYAPLREQPNGGAWYEPVQGLPEKFDLVVCDGPPRNVGDRSALWRVYGGEIAEADWIIDDVEDPQKYVSWGRNVDVRGRFAVVTPGQNSTGEN